MQTSVQTLVHRRVRSIRRGFKAKSGNSMRARLLRFLERAELPVLDDHSIEQYKSEKLAAADAAYEAAALTIRSAESRMMLAKLSMGAAFPLLWFLYTVGIPICLLGIAYVTSAKVLTVHRFLVLLASFAPSTLSYLVMHLYWKHYGKSACEAAKRRCFAIAKSNPKLRWKTSPYDNFTAFHPVPKEVHALVQTIRKRLPCLELVVEHTAVKKYAVVDTVAWDYDPDPILSVRDGRNLIRLRIWDEGGFEPPVRYIVG